MSEELTKPDDTRLPPLSPKQAITLMAIISTTTDDEAIARCPYSRSQFYRLKPQLIKYKETYLNQSLQNSLDMLKALSPKAVGVLGDQLDLKRNEQVRNKAANDILNQAIGKRETIGASFKDGDKEFKFVVTRGTE
ncbi:MAG: hypothetical protein ACM3SR_11385 [Ignavibacteriales bacterium]